MTEIEKEREKVAIIVSEPGSQVAESSTYILIYNKIGRKRRKKRGYKISISLRRTWYIRDCKLTINIRDSTKSSAIHQYRSTYNRQAIFLVCAVTRPIPTKRKVIKNINFLFINSLLNLTYK